MITIDHEEIAARLGRFEDWKLTRDELIYMSDALSSAHWGYMDHDPERMGHFGIGVIACQIASTADRRAVYGADERAARSLILKNLGSIASWLIPGTEDKKQAAALATIARAGNRWTTISHDEMKAWFASQPPEKW